MYVAEYENMKIIYVISDYIDLIKSDSIAPEIVFSQWTVPMIIKKTRFPDASGNRKTRYPDASGNREL